ncbi:tail fiber protein [Xenorhabdus bovienii]|uniref:phage tail protein n=1 Tax=Xenorhabdus bovienii TaxID=40576 RepID=UPI0023B33D32|nr:phage tail protein [Xenorhabdus bovienii]MDE9495929.1 tail fiber protein [Xenorhabdus bovienii]MDE9504319.1 tail fiber protein [Xenorhabdus bovienii]
MQKIGDVTNTADGNGEYTNGNVAAGVAPTILDAVWFNTIQREIINVISKAGIKLNKNNDAQLSEAIFQLISNGKIVLTDNLGNSSGLAVSQKLTNQVNDNANTRLEKSKNGADIPDPKRFVENLGLADTVERANNAVPNSRTVNGKALTGDIIINSQDIFDNPFTIPEYADLNIYRTGGIYYQPSSAWAATGKNYPRGAAGSLIVLRGGYTQRYSVIGSAESYIRGYYDSLGWSAWALEYNSENPQPHNIPVGVPLPYPLRSTPVGYLKCNGQTFNASHYPNLAEVYPSGRVPDLRGEFIRGWDDGRNIDPGRACGTWQEDAFQGHWHTYTMHPYTFVSGTGLLDDFRNQQTATDVHNRVKEAISDGKNGHPRVANETRPRNIAFNYIVRAA